ncbi:Homocysteine S-methyltransferase [Phakopsora pachyrhizi]|uniref:Homocysteine S-methyltransferase n=1 Tax=Phakopsora pachyrhizi TaxID=170000 RepID=A0AAV0AG72_PHAPC|nr:Homocysteine S-methyltransferase [Phakopsora pachyrhizi]CAH7667169.1 Homocysteine S-methyltransferase [Phakopsora pachyrhizi]
MEDSVTDTAKTRILSSIEEKIINDNHQEGLLSPSILRRELKAGDDCDVRDGWFVTVDGGTGTLLEDLYSVKFETNLWSSELIIGPEEYQDENDGVEGEVVFYHKDGEEVLLDLYQGWIDAGSQLILTTTYQSTTEKFFNLFKSMVTRRTKQLRKDSIIIDRTEELLMVEKRILERVSNCLNRLIELPYELIRSEKNRGRDVRLGLSIGPLSSTFEPVSKEYSLFRFDDYPRPFYNDQTREFNREALEEFYLDRLRGFENSIDKVDLIVFETVPINSFEALSIQSSVSKFFKTQDHKNIKKSFDDDDCSEEWRGLRRKPFVVSFVIPNLIDEQDEFERLSIELIEIFERLLNPRNRTPIINGIEGDEEDLMVPIGVGLNCTKLEQISRFYKVFRKHQPRNRHSTSTAGPRDSNWNESVRFDCGLWICPDGLNRLSNYDPVSKTWKIQTNRKDDDKVLERDLVTDHEDWAKELVLIGQKFKEFFDGKVWLGGCCKTGFNHISQLNCLAHG